MLFLLFAMFLTDIHLPHWNFATDNCHPTEDIVQGIVFYFEFIGNDKSFLFVPIDPIRRETPTG